MIKTATFIVLGLFAGPALAQDRAERDFAASVLASLQSRSFDAGREFCGTIGIDDQGRLVASTPRRGRADSCTPRDPRSAIEVIASFHTHGSFSYDAYNEVPSVEDVEGDMADGLNGYVATPGGRLWYIDGETGVSRQLCGIGCLPSDPDFVRGIDGPIAERYTLDELADFLDE